MIYDNVRRPLTNYLILKEIRPDELKKMSNKELLNKYVEISGNKVDFIEVKYSKKVHYTLPVLQDLIDASEKMLEIKKSLKKKRYLDGYIVDINEKSKNQESEYNRYIKSDKWKQLREDLFLIRGKKCESCGSIDKIQVHHKTYVRLFNEKYEDLMVVCKSCHELIHGIFPKELK